MPSLDAPGGVEPGSQYSATCITRVNLAKVFTFLVLVGLSVYCWWMVVSETARRKSDEPGYDFWRLSKEERESWDGLSIASSLIAALILSLASIVFVVVGVYRLFAE